ncbi:MAG: hypothetical protein R3E79_15865 [Caldilineaceae bacterium]
MRGADTPSAPSFAQQLLFCGDRVLEHCGPATAEQVTERWHTWLTGATPQWKRSGVTLFLLRNITRARQLLAGALNVAGQPRALPANADHGLVEALKRTKARLVFAPLNSRLDVLLNAPSAVAWLQPVAGLATG